MQFFDSDFDYRNDFIDRWNERVSQAKVWMIVLGALLVVIGVLSVVVPFGFYTFVQIAIGAALLLHGVGQIGSYFRTPDFFRNSTLAVAGVLNALLGALLLALPSYLTATTLVYPFAFLFIVTGVERLSFAHQMEYFRISNSTLGTVTGVINIILGCAFILMPAISSLLLSYVVAAYLVAIGATLLIEALSLKRIDR